MGRYAAIALFVSTMFLALMAILVNSPQLFYMATAVAAFLMMARLQAWLSVRYLRFERYTAPAVRVGELVTVELVVWSERELKRPLVSLVDGLPKRLAAAKRTRCLAVAPSFDQPIRTSYNFRPMRRGKFRWEKLVVSGTDALGLITMEQTYATDPVELTVYPAPMPIHADIHPLIGWGATDLDSGRKMGAGLEPRGVREFAPGDPLRYIHWRSSAKRDRLMVKEFETGSGVTLHLILQRQQGTDTWTRLGEITAEDTSTFEMMCSNALAIAADFAKKGAMVVFPVHEPRDAGLSHPEAREREVRELLTTIQCDSSTTIAEDVDSIRASVKDGETVVLFVGAADYKLPSAIAGWQDVKVVVLAYDPNDFTSHPTVDSPMRPSYIGELERSGAEVISIPREAVIR